ncbi:low temperature requirement protein A [Actinospica sp.]|uniref:low temperature requirement protein A n=1 Tax=Actinospica sp. TaxID=1872142 RepID=UPI002CE45359|nr:low temperature requirement protein A [Actinospica sp.]HWG27812.1 low temperature requirement protein A [Actinospica sp.]
MIISLRTPRPRGAVGARDTEERHRVSTPLELFFDLCFVVAVGQAGQELAHAIGQGRVAHGVGAYATVFFAIWWAWMNYSWFATAFDPDDIPFRLATFVQIAGSLVIAAGVPRAFGHRDFTVVVIGYVIVRLAFASQWIRVYRDNPELRGLAARWGGGVLVVQVLWVLLQWVHASTAYDVSFAVLAAVELLVPYWAGRAGTLPFHPHHIAERYGLFTLIVLGETVSAATVAVQESMSAHEDVRELVLLALGGLLIVFSAWWIYFAHEVGDLLGERTSPFLWGYGHYVVFGSAASIGAGAEVVAVWTTGSEQISARLAAAAVTVPTAIFLLVVWGLQARHFKSGAAQAVMPTTAAAVLLCSLAGSYAVLLAGLCCAAAVVCGIYAERLGSITGSEPSEV